VICATRAVVHGILHTGRMQLQLAVPSECPERVLCLARQELRAVIRALDARRVLVEIGGVALRRHPRRDGRLDPSCRASPRRVSLSSARASLSHQWTYATGLRDICIYVHPNTHLPPRHCRAMDMMAVHLLKQQNAGVSQQSAPPHLL